MIRRAITTFVALVFSLAAAEIALQVVDARNERQSAENEEALDRTGLPRLTSVWQLAAPNQRGLNSGKLYQTNGYGIRGPERTLEKPNDVFRTLIIGDSFAMGSGVLYEETYAALLERELPAVEGRRHEVINLGISGLNLRAIVERYRRLGLRFAPDLVVYGFTLNDIEGPDYLSIMSCNARREAHRASWSHIWRRVRENWVWFVDAFRPPSDSYIAELDLNYFANLEAWRSFQEQLDALAEIGEAHDVCTLVLVQAQLQMLNRFHPYVRHYERVEAAARERGLATVSSFPFLEGSSAASLSVAPADSHPNARGHEILARAVVDGFSRLPERCFVRADADHGVAPPAVFLGR